MQATLRKFIKQADFKPSFTSLLFNPCHIIRSKLYSEVARYGATATGELLDFGCGSKPYESLFPKVSKYVGCDTKASGHDHIDSKIDYFWDGVTLPFSDGQFDWLVTFEVLDDIFNVDDVLKELHRVTRPGGHVLVTSVFCWEEHEAPYDYARYTTYGLISILEKNGFKVVEHNKTGTYVLSMFQMLFFYLYAYVFPKKFGIRRLLNPILIFPFTLIAYLLNAILPKRQEFYFNNVMLCQRIDTESTRSSGVIKPGTARTE